VRNIPLPREKQKWPPQEWREVFGRYAEWSAWYSGDANRIGNVHAGLAYTPTPKGRFWAKQVKEERQTMLHVPIAGDIAGVSADLIFSEPLEVQISEAHEENAEQEAKDTEDRLIEINNKNDTYSSLLEIAETAAALGGVFAKVNWNRERYDYPLLSVAQADAAIPVFRWGKLQEVTFYKTIREEQRWGEMKYFRHIEHHEPGLIQNRLYVGTKNTIGRELSLEADPYTQDMERDIDTGIDDLLVRYIPNKKPNRLWRGSPLGQSDYSGIEGLMDSLDETFTSWLRDLRLAKARIIVPESWLEFDKNEGQFFFDADKAAFTGLNQGPPGEGQEIEMSQFEVRSQQHEQTALNLIDRIISSAGYSPQSFGLGIEGRAESGTALRVRERKSLKTKEKKQRYMQPPLEDLMHLVLKVDVEILGNTDASTDYRPRIGFADSIPDDPSQKAESLRNIEQATAMSIETKVRWLHEDWSEEEIKAEVERIQREQGILVEEPDMRA